MKRRKFVTLLCAAAVARPVVARAQQQPTPRRIGVLLVGFSAESKAAQQFRRGLRDAGYFEGRDVVNRTAKEGERRTAVVGAIRFLAKPRRNRPAISRRVHVLLAVWEETSTIETIFEDAGIDVFEFIRSLKSVAKGDEVAFRRLTEIAASLAPHLPNSRGRKVSAASAAHEFFLEGVVRTMERRAYTWNPVEGKFTDPVTEATRREFGRRHFDPRPAHRRLTA